MHTGRKTLSNHQNEELMEQLFDEWCEKIRKMNPHLPSENLYVLAEQVAQAEFENRSV